MSRYVQQRQLGQMNEFEANTVGAGAGALAVTLAFSLAVNGLAIYGAYTLIKNRKKKK